MASLATLAGDPVLSASVDLPQRGPWTAEARIASESVPSGAVTLAFADGLSLSGTVRRAGLDAHGSAVAFVVGGKDGLRSTVRQHFRRPFVRDILGAICKASGERQATDIAAEVLTVQLDRYTLAGDCSSALDTLCRAVTSKRATETTWRIRPDGSLWIGAEAWTAARLGKADALLDSYPGIGAYVVGCETPTMTPGIALDSVGRVVSVRHSVTASAVRSWLSVDVEGYGGEFLRATRAALGLRASDPRQLWRYGTFRGRVIAQASDLSTVDVQFDGDVLPAMQAIPVRYPAGLHVQFGSGDLVEVGWDRGDPDRVYAQPVSDGITPIKLVLDGTSIVVNSGTKGAARTDDAISVGSWTHVPAAGVGVTPCSLTYTPPGGVATPIVAAVPVTGKITGGSSSVKVG